MADTNSKNNKSDSKPIVSERGADETQPSGKAKRLAQHQHWMRVMMEGQATPDLTYQKPKT